MSTTKQREQWRINSARYRKRHPDYKRSFYSDNPEYYKEWQRQFRKTPSGRRHVRAMNLKKYGLTPESYIELYVRQGGVCAACGKKEVGKNKYGTVSLAVDHCHKTNRIRGLLCMRCNRALGLIGDDIESARKLVNYLERNQ